MPLSMLCSTTAPWGIIWELTEEGAQPQLANVAWLQTQKIGMVKLTRRKCIRTSAAPKHLKAANKSLPKTIVERPVAC